MPLTALPEGSSSTYDHDKLKDLWIQAGGNRDAADLMAHVALAESGGSPTAKNSYTDNGKTYEVQGLWQISTIHGPGKYYDPLTNAKKAVELYNAQHLSPWEDSRNKGGGGGWGQYVASPSTGHLVPLPGSDHPKPKPKSGIDTLLGNVPEINPSPSPAPKPKPSSLQKLSDVVPEHGLVPIPKVVKRPTKMYGWGSITAPSDTEIAQQKLKSIYKDPNYQGLATGVGTPPSGSSVQMPQFATTALSEIAGHQDAMFILMQAQDRDAKSGRKGGIQELLRDPNSFTANAWSMYKSDPAKAMDEYGVGSPAQNKWEAEHSKGAEQKFNQFLVAHPKANVALTFLIEGFNPMSWAEGLGAGKALGTASHAIGAKNVLRAGQAVGEATGMGSPLAKLDLRGGTEASQWAKSLISNIAAPHKLLHLNPTDKMFQAIFGGLNPEEQEAVVSLSQGGKLDPKFMQQGGDLSKRAALLRSDIKEITKQQVRVGRLTPGENVYDPNTFFPMSHSYDFGEGYTLEDELRGMKPAGAGTVNRPKSFDSMTQARASGLLDENFLPANNYSTWREQRLQQVAFEDAMNRAPKSLLKEHAPTDYVNKLGEHPSNWVQSAFEGPTDALKRSLAQNRAKFPPGHPERFEPIDQALSDNPYLKSARPENIPSPALRKSAMAPELASFLSEHQGLQKYLGSGTVHLGGEGSWFGAKFLTFARNAIVSNFVYHPTLNVAPREAAARGLHDLGGPTWEVGGAAYNMGRAVAQQAGVDPAKFVGGAQQYAKWLDKALVDGATEEFGMPKASALGGERARVLTVPQKTWLGRLDKALTKFGDFNRERTFGEKGAESFAVSLFKSAVQSGKMSDAQAARITSEAIGDLYNFDPKSKLSSFLFFMPWRKGNWKFWTNVLVRKPQYVTGPAHAIRNYEEQTSPDAMTGPFGHPDFSLPGEAWSLPFVGRDEAHIANIAGSVAGRQGVSPVLNEATTLALGSANPLVRMGENIISTRDASFNKDVKGPETDFNLIVNPKAPPNVQYRQLANYFLGHGVPVPLIGFAVQRASQKGVAPQDAFKAIASAVGLGFAGSEHLNDDQRKTLSEAQARYKKAWDRYTYDDHDLKALNEAWDEYYQGLKDAGVVH